MAEKTIYLNEEWHTRKVRDASAELVDTAQKVLHSLMPPIQELDSENMPVKPGNDIVRGLFANSLIPGTIREQWDRNEMWVLRFITSLPHHASPGRIDSSIRSRMESVDVFASVEQALNYFQLTDNRFTFLQKNLAGYRFGAITLAGEAYIESRVLRFATQGQYLTRPGVFTPVEN